MKQNSVEWYDLRKGRFTSSQIYRLMATAQKVPENPSPMDLLSKGAKTYVLENVAEVMTGRKLKGEGVTNKAMKYGHKWEPIARLYYELDFQQTQSMGFIPWGLHAGGSPDALIDPDGLLEIKCPFSKHWSYIDSIHDQESFKNNTDIKSAGYYDQIQSLLLFSHREWCDWMTFDPKDPNLYKIIRITRDEERIAKIEEKLELAINAKLYLLNNIYGHEEKADEPIQEHKPQPERNPEDDSGTNGTSTTRRRGRPRGTKSTSKKS